MTTLLTEKKETKKTQPHTSHDKDSDMELFRQYQKTKVFNEEGKLIKRDEKLRNQLIIRNEKLVLYIVGKFFTFRQKFLKKKDDLIQEGMLGLFDAVDNFDPSLGFMFSTYATWWIKQACNNFIVEKDPIIKAPSHIRTAKNKIVKELKEKKLDQTIENVKNISNGLGYSKKMGEAVNHALYSNQVRSFEDTRRDGGQYSNDLDEEIAIELNSMNNHEKSIEKEMIEKAVRKSLDILSDKERTILLLRFNAL